MLLHDLRVMTVLFPLGMGNRRGRYHVTHPKGEQNSYYLIQKSNNDDLMFGSGKTNCIYIQNLQWKPMGNKQCPDLPPCPNPTKFFHFDTISLKRTRVVGRASPTTVGAPSNGKSWICP